MRAHIGRNRQNLLIPLLPLALQLPKDIRMTLCQIGTFALVFYDIEQKFIAADAQILPVTGADCALGIGLVTPQQGARLIASLPQ